MSLGACQFGYTQGVALPAGFPEYVDTGNPERDMADFAARKHAWVVAHPIEYEQYQKNQAPHVIREATSIQSGHYVNGLDKVRVTTREKALEKNVPIEREEYKALIFLVPEEWEQADYPNFETYPVISQMLQQRVMWAHTHTDLFILCMKKYDISLEKIVGEDKELQANLQELTQVYIEKARLIQGNAASFDAEQVKWSKDFLKLFETY